MPQYTFIIVKTNPFVFVLFSKFICTTSEYSNSKILYHDTERLPYDTFLNTSNIQYATKKSRRAFLLFMYPPLSRDLREYTDVLFLTEIL